MLRYLTGGTKLPEKRKQSEEDKRERDKLYDSTKRQRRYLKSWESKYTWLHYDEEKSVMYCTLCRQHYTATSGNRGKNAFIAGTNNFRPDSLQAHQTSDAHKRVIDLQSAVDASPGTAPAHRALQALNKTALDRINILFRTCHALAKHRRPYTDYIWQCELDSKKRLDVGKTYRNDKAAKEFTHAIAEVERNHLVASLESAKFLSLISDGTTDSSIAEAEILFVRFAVEGLVETKFVGVENVAKADAPTIKRAIDSMLKHYVRLSQDRLVKKLVGFGSDGAAVMIGRTGGVATLFKNVQPCLQAIHCYAHRLELAYKDALKKVTLCGTLSNLLLSFYLFYHHSPLNRSNLKTTFQTLSLPQRLPTRVGGTRWLPHLLKALQNVLDGYPAIMLHLAQMQTQGGSGEAKAKAKGFLTSLRRRDLLEMAHFMLDVLLVLSKLSLVAQTKTATVADVHASLASTMSWFDKYKGKPTPKERSFNRGLDIDEEPAFHGEKLPGPGFAAETRSRVLDNICSYLQGRFDGLMEALWW